MDKQEAPTFDQIATWCERHDSHPTEGWLTLLLDGTYSVAELCAAIRADRLPEDARALAADTKKLQDAVLDMPTYRGWYVARADDHRQGGDERLVWKHEDYDEKIWFDVVHESRGRVSLRINHDDPNGDPYHPRGGHEELTAHTAEAVFAVFKPLLDEYSSDGDNAEDTVVL